MFRIYCCTREFDSAFKHKNFKYLANNSFFVCLKKIKEDLVVSGCLLGNERFGLIPKCIFFFVSLDFILFLFSLGVTVLVF